MSITAQTLSIVAALTLCIGTRVNADGPRHIPFTAVRVTDGFWSPKQAVYRDKTIPHSWQYVQREIEDNEIAAGWKQIERGQDTPWNQANLHKVLETVAYSLGQQPNPELDKKMDYIVSAIAGAQQPNGYVNALITVRHMKPWTNLDGQHEGYVAGHMIEAAVAHYQATGKREFLNIACKMADHIYQTFITEKHEGVCGHAELELALVRLYRVTGQKRYLELAKEWIERRGKPFAGRSDTPRAYFMDHLPIRQVPEVTGHAVRTMFYLTGVADVGLETGDEGLRAAARRLWADTVTRKMYVTGAVGSQEKDEGFGAAYDLPNHGYNESCAACGLLYYADAIYRLDGDASAMDVVERVLYNSALHCISLDGVNTYYRNPLSDENNPRNNIWVCCPPCLSRTLLRMQEYIYAVDDASIYVNLYAGNTAQIQVGKQRVSISQQTSYPWDGAVKVTVSPTTPGRFTLRLRIPGWCEKAGISVNGKVMSRYPVSKGYAVISRQWRAGDVVALNLPMAVQRVVAHPQVKEDASMVALQRGPIVYGVEGLDNGGSVDLRLARDPKLTASHRADLLGGVTVITGALADGRGFTAIPFYALANRQPSKQAVWLKQDQLAVMPAGWDGVLYRAMR